MYMCVCVCVCVSERERERERQTDRQTDRQTESMCVSARLLACLCAVSAPPSPSQSALRLTFQGLTKFNGLGLRVWPEPTRLSYPMAHIVVVVVSYLKVKVQGF